mmetsp:Transcript_45679/g.115172  ORF Transcript_45679/g.115172 Transcript_45679/m.115172 type:complete len:330 (+) Transcript_45679:992-1981(+)
MAKVFTPQVQPIHATLLLQLANRLSSSADKPGDDAVRVRADRAVHRPPGALRGQRPLGLGPDPEAGLDAARGRAVLPEADVAAAAGAREAEDLLGLTEGINATVEEFLIGQRVHVDLAVRRCGVHLGPPRHRHLVDVQHEDRRPLPLLALFPPLVALLTVRSPFVITCPSIPMTATIVITIAVTVVITVAVTVTISVAVAIAVAITVTVAVIVPVALPVILLAMGKLAPIASVANPATEVVAHLGPITPFLLTRIPRCILRPVLVFLVPFYGELQRPPGDLLPRKLTVSLFGISDIPEAHSCRTTGSSVYLLNGQHIDAEESAGLDSAM